MNNSNAELMLGTAQFGLSYGVAGRGEPIPENEVRIILRRAFELGIRALDTAAVYGDIEQRLLRLADGCEFLVVSKIPKIPNIAEPEAIAWAQEALLSSVRRLGPLLKGVLFHSAEDLVRPDAHILWDTSSEVAHSNGIRLGVSCYDPQTLLQLLARDLPITIAQLPGNALDQRLGDIDNASIGDAWPEIHVRSVFLQGLLLMPESQATQKIPAAAGALRCWHDWCAAREMTPLACALAIAKGLPRVRYCVVGVNSVEQLEEIATHWRTVPAIRAHELSTRQLEIIDPRRWAV